MINVHINLEVLTLVVKSFQELNTLLEKASETIRGTLVTVPVLDHGGESIVVSTYDHRQCKNKRFKSKGLYDALSATTPLVIIHINRRNAIF